MAKHHTVRIRAKGPKLSVRCVGAQSHNLQDNLNRQRSKIFMGPKEQGSAVICATLLELSEIFDPGGDEDY